MASVSKNACATNFCVKKSVYVKASVCKNVSAKERLCVKTSVLHLHILHLLHLFFPSLTLFLLPCLFDTASVLQCFLPAVVLYQYTYFKDSLQLSSWYPAIIVFSSTNDIVLFTYTWVTCSSTLSGHPSSSFFQTCYLHFAFCTLFLNVLAYCHPMTDPYVWYINGNMTGVFGDGTMWSPECSNPSATFRGLVSTAKHDFTAWSLTSSRRWPTDGVWSFMRVLVNNVWNTVVKFVKVCLMVYWRWFCLPEIGIYTLVVKTVHTVSQLKPHIWAGFLRKNEPRENWKKCHHIITVALGQVSNCRWGHQIASKWGDFEPSGSPM